MRFRALVLLALGLAVLLAGPARGQDDDEPWDDGPDLEDAPEAEQYEGALTPYGAWYDDGALGRIWRPSVAVGWAPYVDGRWVWSPAGWTWVSWEPWAWTFHYGRWSWAPAFGWVWLPGTVWAPAWVNWWWGNGWVGWAPYGAVGFHHWHWVRGGDLCAPRVRHVVVRDRYLPHDVRTLWHGRGGHHDAPRRHDIERISHHRILTHDRRPPETVAPWRRAHGGQGRELEHRPGGRARDGTLEHRPGGRARDGTLEHGRDARARGGTLQHGRGADPGGRPGRGHGDGTLEHDGDGGRGRGGGVGRAPGRDRSLWHDQSGPGQDRRPVSPRRDRGQSEHALGGPDPAPQNPFAPQAPRERGARTQRDASEGRWLRSSREHAPARGGRDAGAARAFRGEPAGPRRGGGADFRSGTGARSMSPGGGGMPRTGGGTVAPRGGDRALGHHGGGRSAQGDRGGGHGSGQGARGSGGGHGGGQGARAGAGFSGHGSYGGGAMR